MLTKTTIMSTKTTIALAAALVLGSASAVLANDNDRNDRGGFHFGPLGQPMGAPYAWGGYRTSPYAYVPSSGLNSISYDHASYGRWRAGQIPED
jgi:hypothetical protein